MEIEVNVPLINDTELIGLLQLSIDDLNTHLSDYMYMPITITILDQKQSVGIVIWDPITKQIYATPF